MLSQSSPCVFSDKNLSIRRINPNIDLAGDKDPLPFLRGKIRPINYRKYPSRMPTTCPQCNKRLAQTRSLKDHLLKSCKNRLTIT